MKNILILVFSLLLFQACSNKNSIFILEPSQSMSITGKGIGQDAAYNPYSNGNSIAIVKNIGENSIDARIQEKGKIIEILTLQPTESRNILLLKGYELYLDSDLASKAKVNFKDSKG